RWCRSGASGRVEFFGGGRGSATVVGVTRIVARLGVAARAVLALGLLGLGAGAGCGTSTEFFNEGPGGPTDRATGTVPDGLIGVSPLPNTARPVTVDTKLWEHSRPCPPRTPARFIRLGYTPVGATNEADALKEQEGMLATLKEGQRDDGGNNKMVALMRSLH